MKHSWKTVIALATKNANKICSRCKNLTSCTDRELCCTYFLCKKYGGFILQNKHTCKRLRKEIVRRIRQYAKEQ